MAGNAVWAIGCGVAVLLLLGQSAGNLWGQAPANRPVAEEMAALTAALPASGWKAEQYPWTPAMLRNAAGLLGERERAEKILERWQDGHSLVWHNRTDPGRQTALGVLRFKDANGARAYYGLAADLQRKQDEKIRGGCGTDRCVLDSRCRAVTVTGSDEAFCVERRWQVAGGPAVSVCQLWVRTGLRVLEFSWSGGPADLPWAERVHLHLVRTVTTR